MTFSSTSLFTISCALYFFTSACKPIGDNDHVGSIDSALFLQGKQLSLQLCGQCHVYPEPGLLDKYAWKQYVMPEMSNYYGYYYNEQEQYASMLPDMVEALSYLGQIPEEPSISPEEWQSILYFYQVAAPKTLSKTIANFNIPKSLDSYKMHFSPKQHIEPGVTLLKTADNVEGFWYADEGYGELRLVDAQMNIKRAIKIPGTPVGMTLLGDYWYVLTMAVLPPPTKG